MAHRTHVAGMQDVEVWRSPRAGITSILTSASPPVTQMRIARAARISSDAFETDRDRRFVDRSGLSGRQSDFLGTGEGVVGVLSEHALRVAIATRTRPARMN